MNFSNDIIIEKQLLKEKDQIAESIQKTGNMSIQDLEKLERIYHTLKSQAAYCGMKDPEGYWDQFEDDQNGMSGRRGRAANGQYISRDTSYEDGYNRGYSEAMSRTQDGTSGHYPMMPETYRPRRW